MTSSYIDSHKGAGKGAKYDEVYRSDPWHRYLWSREQEVLNCMLRDLYRGQPVDVLDFACGTGRIASALEANVREIVGVDVSASMLEIARTKLKRTTLIQGNIVDGPVFSSRNFNLITAFRFFVNAEQDLRLAALRALVPYLAPDGYFVFNNHQNSDSAYIKLTRAYANLKGFRFANTLSMAECAALMATVDFEIVRVYPVAMLHLPRVHFPPMVYRWADRVGGWSQAFANRAESPIIVARRRR
jgi:predicted TPR repeat methyltransferase